MTPIYDPYDGPIPDEHKKFYTELGRRFRDARIKRGYSLNELAALVNITPERLEQYENAELVFPIYEILPMVQYMGYPDELNHVVVD